MSDDEIPDPDRAAILARRRRFIALAISGLTTGGCKHQPPHPCLSISMPGEDEGTEAKTGAEGEGEPNASGPFVEDPGAPVESETSETGETGEASEPTPEPHPQPCLKVRPTPRPCLNVYRK